MASNKKKKGLASVLGVVVSVAVPFFAPAIAGAIGLSGAVGAAVVGAAGGAVGSALQGGNVLQGAALGGIGGGISGLASGANAGLNTAKGAAQAGQSTAAFGDAVTKIASPITGPSIISGATKGVSSSVMNLGPGGAKLAGLTVPTGQPANILPPGSNVTGTGGGTATQVGPSGAVTSTPGAGPGQAPVGAPGNTSIAPTSQAAQAAQGAKATTITDPNAMRQAQLAQQSGQTASGTKNAVTPMANTSGQTPRAGLMDRIGQYAQPLAQIGSRLLSGTPETPDLTGLFDELNNGGAGSPEGLIEKSVAATDQANELNTETYKYRVARGREQVNRANQFDPYELAQKEGFASSERAGAAADAAAREEAATGGRRTGRRRANKRRAGLDAARQSSVGFDRGFRTGHDVSLAYDRAADSWLSGSLQPASYLDASSAGQNVATQRANVEAAQYGLERDAAREQEEWNGALARLVSGAGSYRQPGQATERDLWAPRAGLFA